MGPDQSQLLWLATLRTAGIWPREYQGGASSIGQALDVAQSCVTYLSEKYLLTAACALKLLCMLLDVLI